MPPLDAPSLGRQSARKRPVVLLIEDNVLQLDLYSLVLEDEFDLVQATHGEGGYRLACRHVPDVIVVDVLLPDDDGLAVCERLRANPLTATIPLIVLTGDDTAYARAQVARSALVGVFMKPCAADRLLAAIKSAVERSCP